MLLLRTFSVGLLLSVIFIMGTANKFIQLMIGTSPVFAFQMAFLQRAPEAANLLGAGSIIPTAYIIFCLGLGFFIASLFWPAFDSTIFFVLKGVEELLDKLMSKLFNKSKKAVILSGILLVAAAAGMTTRASAQEFVSVLPAQQVEFKAQPGAPGGQILFPAGYSEKAVLVNGLRVSSTEKESFPVQIRTSGGAVIQTEAKIELVAGRFDFRLLSVIVGGKQYPAKGYVTDETHMLGISARTNNNSNDNQQKIFIVSPDTPCFVVFSEEILAKAEK